MNEITHKKGWLVIEFLISPGEAGTASDELLALGALSVEMRDAYSGLNNEISIFEQIRDESQISWKHVILSALFKSSDDFRKKVFFLEKKLGGFGASLSQHYHIKDRDWVSQIKHQSQPERISDNFWICPSWLRDDIPSNVTSVILNPGLAFGTGSHPSTKLCLCWLTQNSIKNFRVLDYGCGSGILAIASKILGAPKVTAVDIDEDALLVTKMNAQENNVIVEVVSAEKKLDLKFDLLIANILAKPLIVLAPIFAQFLNNGGKIILSGILKSQTSEVIDQFEPWFSISVSDKIDDWVLLEGDRRSGSAQ